MLSVLASAILLSAQAAPAAAPATRQQLFDRATAAMNANKCEDAVRDFQAIEAGGKAMSAAVAGAVGVRKGVCLVRLGRDAEGEAALRAGVTKLAPLGAEYVADVRLARLTLGRMAYLRYDYGASEQEFAAALALSKDQERVEPLLLLARTTMFDDGPKPLAYADEALALVAADATVTKDSRAAARTMRARVLLNQGQFKPGYDDLREALKLQGGLGLKVTQADVATRGDLALAALLNKNPDDARKYLAYTGAGRLKDGPLARASAIDLPPCGEEAGLRPEDSTVVEFGIGTDGAVAYATPIWSTGDRAVALEFARAVSNWSWTPDAVASIPPFQRTATRVQLRCSTVGERPALTGVLEETTAAWLATKGVAMPESRRSAARAVPEAKAQLAALAATPGASARIPVLADLGGSPILPDAERGGYLSEAYRIAAAGGAPIATRTLLRLRGLSMTPWERSTRRGYRDSLRKLLADPEVAADPHSAGVVALSLVRSGQYSRPVPDVDQLIASVATDARLPADDPLRVAALLEQSARANAAGRIEEARAAFEKTGLTEQQCALLGIQPAQRRTGASSADFPREAFNWGFEGWVRVEFDIQADGRTAQQRAVASYPPFIFDDAATGVAKDARYEATYRPSGGTACSGQQRQIVFQKES